MMVDIITLITLISGLAALSSSLIALFTLFEIRVQRKKSLMPELVIYKPNVHLSWHTIGDKKIPVNWSKTSIQETNHNFQKYHFEVSNIGLQSAKSIKVSWEYNIEELIGLIHKSNGDRQYQIDIDDIVKWLSVNLDGKMILGMDTIIELNKEIDFIAPLSITKEVTRIEIPTSFQLLTSLLYSQCNNTSAVLDLKPTISLKITYQDISDNLYQKVFSYKFQLTSFHPDASENDLNAGYGVFQSI
jgi:hypothetical protein